MSKRLTGLLAVGLTLAAMASASAADLTVPTEPPPLAIPNEWRFQATLYGWALSLNGDVGVGRLPDADVDVSFADILKHLDGVFMGAFIARNDTFIVGADLIWAKVSADVDLKEGNGPLARFTRGANVSFDETMTIATGFGGVRLPIGSPDFQLYATAGARYWRLDASLTLDAPAIGFSRENGKTVDWVDPLVGLAMQYRINDQWFVNGLADIGGFGIGADIDTQGLLSVGYNWTPSFATTVGFRALYADYSSGDGRGSFRYNTTMYGPFVGLSLLF